METQRTAAGAQALARHTYQAAKMQADSWARIIADDVVAAASDWAKLPTRKMLDNYVDAVKAETVARAAWDRADSRAAS